LQNAYHVAWKSVKIIDWKIIQYGLRYAPYS